MKSINQVINESVNIGIPVLDKIEQAGEKTSKAKKIFGQNLEPFMGYVIKYEGKLRWVCWDFESDWIITDKNTINEFKNITEDDMIPVILKPIKI